MEMEFIDMIIFNAKSRYIKIKSNIFLFGAKDFNKGWNWYWMSL